MKRKMLKEVVGWRENMTVARHARDGHVARLVFFFMNISIVRKFLDSIIEVGAVK